MNSEEEGKMERVRRGQGKMKNKEDRKMKKEEAKKWRKMKDNE